MLKINSFDPEWTLPSLMAENPMIWMIQIDGMIVDVRDMPKEIQEDAFSRGLIPYIPDAQESEEADE
jgi:hypothetical protein